VRANAAPTGYGAPDLEAAYRIDPHAQQVATIAIVDAFGYPTARGRPREVPHAVRPGRRARSRAAA